MAGRHHPEGAAVGVVILAVMAIATAARVDGATGGDPRHGDVPAVAGGGEGDRDEVLSLVWLQRDVLGGDHELRDRFGPGAANWQLTADDHGGRDRRRDRGRVFQSSESLRQPVQEVHGSPLKGTHFQAASVDPDRIAVGPAAVLVADGYGDAGGGG